MNKNRLTEQEKVELSELKFKKGMSNEELNKKYGISSRHVIRIANAYREYEKAAFAKKTEIAELIDKRLQG